MRLVFFLVLPVTVAWATASDARSRAAGRRRRNVHPDRSWRARGLYRDIVANLAWDRPDQAEAFIRTMPQGNARAYVERRRAEGR